MLRRSPSRWRRRPTGRVVVRLTSVTLFQTPYDKAPKGPSAGDRYVVKSRLLNRVPAVRQTAGRDAGRDQGTATLVDAKTVVKSVGVAKLPGGTIRFQGTGKLGTPPDDDAGRGRERASTRARAGRSCVCAGRRAPSGNTYTLKLPVSA